LEFTPESPSLIFDPSLPNSGSSVDGDIQRAVDLGAWRTELGAGRLREADRTVAAESLAMLSPAESRRFLSALSKPFSPNAALRKALAKGESLGI
jgi:hypothetical protein